MNLIAVYGSLRKGEYNNKYFANGMEYKGTVIVPNFNLYSLGSYPGIKPGENNLVCDIFEVDEYTEALLDDMELGAGYSIEYVNTEFGKSKIYTYDDSINENYIIVHGDWTKRKNKEICVD